MLCLSPGECNDRRVSREGGILPPDGRPGCSRFSYWQRISTNAKSKYAVGDQVEILYSSRNPSRFILDSWDSWIPFIIITILVGYAITFIVVPRNPSPWCSYGMVPDLDVRVSCRSGSAQFIAGAGRRFGSRSKIRMRPPLSARPKRIGAADGFAHSTWDFEGKFEST